MNTREVLQETGYQVLGQARNELYLSMRFMGEELDALIFVMDLSTRTIGTDAANIRFNALWLLHTYLDRPLVIRRAYIHMIVHCIFRHMFTSASFADPALFDLCADIAAESVVDGMDYDVIRNVSSDYRESWYRKLTEEVQVLTAEKLYQYFEAHPLSFEEEAHLAREFHVDDHSFWARIPRDEDQDKDSEDEGEEPPLPQGGGPQDAEEQEAAKPKSLLPLNPGKLKEDWKERGERLKAEIELLGREASKEVGSLSKVLSFTYDPRRDYRDFLKRFMVWREEIGVDPDSFDLGFYYYGMEHYGNMPLIEENEFRETNKVDQLVIAIDTSASCQDSLVRKFLNDTAGILLGGKNFFHRVQIHIIACDDQVQEDTIIENVDEMKRYADGFTLKGGYGTDFRPVFTYVDALRKSGQLQRLKGLMYFTDGFGTYPTHPTTYDTAFVFHQEEAVNDEEVPDWALKLYMGQEKELDH